MLSLDLDNLLPRRKGTFQSILSLVRNPMSLLKQSSHRDEARRPASHQGQVLLVLEVMCSDCELHRFPVT
jgi:hypothetical protein